MMQLSEVCAAVGGHMQGGDVSLKNISINTREDCTDRLFVALKGDNFDAHDYITQAAEAGAGAVMVERSVTTQLPSLLVADTHIALKKMAAWWRSRFAIPLIGVTGSVGKTTVKEMLKSIFSGYGQGVVTKGNLNNEIGVPLTLMRLSESDQYAIVEMGMNQAGEIACLTQIAQPKIALVNNAAAAHLEGLGTIEAVAKAKGEIFSGLSADGIAIINLDDPYFELWQELAEPYRIITFGLSDKADVTASYCEKNNHLRLDVVALGECFELSLTAVGRHSVSNALAATAVAVAADVSIALIQSGIAAYRPANGRLNIMQFADNTLIDDTYNANPASMRAAIEVLAQRQDTTLIIGDMAELGATAEHAHKDIGVVARSQGIDRLYACGQFSDLVAKGFGEGAIAYREQSDLLSQLKQDGLSGSILVKGSRSAKMERVVAVLTEILGRKTPLDVANNTRKS